MMARIVWMCINLVSMSLIGVKQPSFDQIHAHLENNRDALFFNYCRVLELSGATVQLKYGGSIHYDSQS